MQPNRSPTTGSSRLPSRSSTFVTPLRARLKAANASARAFTSVATTCAGVAGEQERLDPVPGADVERPLDRLPDRQVRERRPTGGGRPRRGPLRRRRAGRMRSGARRAGRRARARAASRRAPRRDPPRRAAPRARPAAPSSPSSRSEISSDRRSGAAASRRRYTSRSTCVKIGSPLVCRRRAIPAPLYPAAASSPPAGAPRVSGAGGSGRRLQILTFFVRSQPPCTGASSEPSAFCGA